MSVDSLLTSFLSLSMCNIMLFFSISASLTTLSPSFFMFPNYFWTFSAVYWTLMNSLSIFLMRPASILTMPNYAFSVKPKTKFSFSACIYCDFL